MDNQLLFCFVAAGVMLVAAAREIPGQASRVVNLLGFVAGLVAFIGVLVR